MQTDKDLELIIQTASSETLAVLTMALSYIESCPYEECALLRVEKLISKSLISKFYDSYTSKPTKI